MTSKLSGYEAVHTSSKMIDRISGGSFVIGSREFSTLYWTANISWLSVEKCLNREFKVEFNVSRYPISFTRDEMLKITFRSVLNRLFSLQTEGERSQHTLL